MSVSVKNLFLLITSAVFLNFFIYQDSMKESAIYKIHSVEPTNEVVVLPINKETKVNDIQYHHKVKTTYMNIEGKIEHSNSYFQNIDEAFDLNNYKDAKKSDGNLWTILLIVVFFGVLVWTSGYYINYDYNKFALTFFPVVLITLINFIISSGVFGLIGMTVVM